MSITIDKINKSYGKDQALSDIKFSLKKGEIIGLLGPNGAGKSTLMKIICCYLKQDSGTIKVCDLDTQKDELIIKSKIGYLPEKNPLYLDMYVKEYLHFIGGTYKIKEIKNRVREVIQKTGLNIEYKKKIKQLSKGFQQRVGLAAALIHDPEILILDEPTTGLDPNQLMEIRTLIKEMGVNKTVILSTHIMQEVDKMCNRIIIINQGKIVDDKLIVDLKKINTDLEKHFRQLTS